MDISVINFWGKTKYWWALLALGIMVVIGGFWLLFQPVIGYAVLSMLLGWFLVIAGVMQLIVSTNIKKESHSWGWWLAGGIFDIFIGFVLVGNLMLSEITLPYFFAFAFLFKGITNLISSFSMAKTYKFWWVYLINGLLLLFLSWLFFMGPFTASYAIVLLCAFAFIYWGFSIIVFSYDIKPGKDEIGNEKQNEIHGEVNKDGDKSSGEE